MMIPPQGYQAGQPAGPGGPPAPVLNAARFMYAGAGLAVALGIGAALLLLHPVVPPGTADPAAFRAGYAVGAVAGGSAIGGIVAALWLWMAWAARNGRSWARVLSIILFAALTLYSAGGILLLPAVVKVLAGFEWVAGLGALVFLWQARSSAYFDAVSRASAMAAAPVPFPPPGGALYPPPGMPVPFPPPGGAPYPPGPAEGTGPLPPVSSPPDRRQRVLMWVSAGTSLAVLAAVAVAGIVLTRTPARRGRPVSAGTPVPASPAAVTPPPGAAPGSCRQQVQAWLATPALAALTSAGFCAMPSREAPPPPASSTSCSRKGCGRPDRGGPARRRSLDREKTQISRSQVVAAGPGSAG